MPILIIITHWYTIYFLPVKMLGTSGFFTTAISTAATAATPTAKHIPPPYHFQDGQYGVNSWDLLFFCGSKSDEVDLRPSLGLA